MFSDEEIHDAILRGQVAGSLAAGATILETDRLALSMLDLSQVGQIDSWIPPRVRLAMDLSFEILSLYTGAKERAKVLGSFEELDDLEFTFEASTILAGMVLGQQLQRLGVRLDYAPERKQIQEKPKGAIPLPDGEGKRKEPPKVS